VEYVKKRDIRYHKFKTQEIKEKEIKRQKEEEEKAKAKLE
jgi:hypothetical protein